MYGRPSSSASGASPSSASSQFSVPTRSWAVSTSVPSRSKAMTAPARGFPAAVILAPGRSGAIDDGGGLVELGGIGGQRLAGQADVFLGVVETPLLDGLADPRQGLGAIAG